MTQASDRYFPETLTPAQQAQIDQCSRMLTDGANPSDMRDLGFAQAAIDAAINAAGKDSK
ncbi:hypothetical protein ACGYLO_16525 [Sulfitobacter sp. 1A13353]|uniref:hypothetical protein n=1 Tax=Sulfitobacter sp. 1A13353 TaxID=3368568 RepID=UPI003745D74A